MGAFSMALFLLLAAGALSAYSGGEITGYTPVMIPCTTKLSPDGLIALRHFRINGRQFFLVVERDTLKTRIEQADTLVFDAFAPGMVFYERVTSPYMAALAFSTSPPYSLHNGGIRRFGRNHGGAVLTADLCPSKHGLTRGLFTGLLKALGAPDRPVPVGIAVSGKWIENHGPDIKWLQSLESKNSLSITWINHSYSHPRTYAPSPLTLSRGFLLTKGVDFPREVLLTEKRMIENGMVPSVFFRYPGLVSDGKLMEKLREYGLIALGSDAWLAKRERPGKGSIILVHANGHEPDGIKRFFSLLRKLKPGISGGTWKLLDLRHIAAADFRDRHIKKAVPDRMAYRRLLNGTASR